MTSERTEPPPAKRGLEQRHHEARGVSRDSTASGATDSDLDAGEQLAAKALEAARRQREWRAAHGISEPGSDPEPAIPSPPASEPPKPSKELLELIGLVERLASELGRGPGVGEIFVELERAGVGTRQERRRTFSRAVATGFLRRATQWDTSGRRKIRDEVVVTESGWRLLEAA